MSSSQARNADQSTPPASNRVTARFSHVMDPPRMFVGHTMCKPPQEMWLSFTSRKAKEGVKSDTSAWPSETGTHTIHNSLIDHDTLPEKSKDITNWHTRYREQWEATCGAPKSSISQSEKTRKEKEKTKQEKEKTKQEKEKTKQEKEKTRQEKEKKKQAMGSVVAEPDARKRKRGTPTTKRMQSGTDDTPPMAFDTAKFVMRELLDPRNFKMDDEFLEQCAKALQIHHKTPEIPPLKVVKRLKENNVAQGRASATINPWHDDLWEEWFASQQSKMDEMEREETPESQQKEAKNKQRMTSVGSSKKTGHAMDKESGWDQDAYEKTNADYYAWLKEWDEK